jgi:hypothetical protein
MPVHKEVFCILSQCTNITVNEATEDRNLPTILLALLGLLVTHVPKSAINFIVSVFLFFYLSASNTQTIHYWRFLQNLAMNFNFG